MEIDKIKPFDPCCRHLLTNHTLHMKQQSSPTERGKRTTQINKQGTPQRRVSKVCEERGCSAVTFSLSSILVI